MSQTPEALLLARVLELAPDKDPGAAVQLGEQEWPAIQSRPVNRYDAEACRLLALASATHGRYDLAAVWRARALIRFSELGWSDGVATIILGEALANLSRHNDDYARGRTLDVIENSPASLGILETIEHLAQPGRTIPDDQRLSNWSPSPDLTARMYWEKKGFFELLEGQWDAARSSYAKAQAVARPGRGASKVHGAIVAVEYLSALAGVPHRGDLESLIEEQEAVVAEITAVSDPDIEKAAVHNLEVMRRGGRDLLPYEIL